MYTKLKIYNDSYKKVNTTDSVMLTYSLTCHNL